MSPDAPMQFGTFRGGWRWHICRAWRPLCRISVSGPPILMGVVTEATLAACNDVCKRCAKIYARLPTATPKVTLTPAARASLMRCALGEPTLRSGVALFRGTQIRMAGRLVEVGLLTFVVNDFGSGRYFEITNLGLALTVRCADCKDSVKRANHPGTFVHARPSPRCGNRTLIGANLEPL